MGYVDMTIWKCCGFWQNFEFGNSRSISARLPPVEVKIAVFWIYILGIWLYFGCLNLYFGCLNLYFGCLNLYRLCWVSELILLGIRGPSILRTRELEILKDQAFWYDLWIWKYWRIGTCGLAAHFKTMGLEPVDFRPISRPWDWNLWTSSPFQDHGIGTVSYTHLTLPTKCSV